MGPCERPLTVAVFDSHLLSKSIGFTTVLKAEVALIAVSEPVPIWFRHVCLCTCDGMSDSGALNSL